MSNPIGGSFADGAEARAHEFVGEIGDELDHASRHVRRGFERAGSALDDGAERLKDGIRHTTDGVKTASKRVSDVIGHSTDYLRTNPAAEIIDDLNGVVRRHPGKALLAVAAMGFLLGRALTSKD